MITPPTLAEIAAQERKIGKHASRMIEKSIKNQIKVFGLESNSPSKESLINSVKSKENMGKFRLFGIQTTMARHGFIHQHGTTGQRTGHIRHIKKTDHFFNVKEHSFYLGKRTFIENGIQKSGAFDYLFNELGKLRMKEVSIVFNRSEINIK